MSTDPLTVLLGLHVILACGAILLGADAAARGGLAGDWAWAGCLAAASLACLAWIAQSADTQGWTVDLGGPLMTLSVGLFWSGTRRREGQSPRLWLPIASATLVLALGFVPVPPGGSSLLAEGPLLVALVWLVVAGLSLWRTMTSHYLGDITLGLVLAGLTLLYGFRVVAVIRMEGELPNPMTILANSLAAGLAFAMAAAAALAMLAFRNGDVRLRETFEFDPILGVRSPRALARRAEHISEADRNAGQPTAVVIVEIADLAALREAFGLVVAEAASEVVASTMIATSPRGALVGGSLQSPGQFVAVLRHTDEEGARMWARGMARTVQETALRTDHDVVRVGVRTAVASGKEPYLALKAAAREELAELSRLGLLCL